MTCLALKTPPNRLWRGKRRLVHKLEKGLSRLRWTLSLKPGDYVAMCRGYNVRVQEVTYFWANEGAYRRRRPNKTWYLEDVRIEDVYGNLHYANSCCWPAETPEQVTEYFRYWVHDATASTWHTEVDVRIRAALEAGSPIVDSFGELLDEFKR